MFHQASPALAFSMEAEAVGAHNPALQEQEAPALVAVEDWVTVTSETLHHQPTKGLAVEAETITLQGPEVPVL